jgi:hypothetical protein
VVTAVYRTVSPGTDLGVVAEIRPRRAAQRVEGQLAAAQGVGGDGLLVVPLREGAAAGGQEAHGDDAGEGGLAGAAASAGLGGGGGQGGLRCRGHGAAFAGEGV